MSSDLKPGARGSADIRIVDAAAEHLGTITDIYNDAVRHTTAVWSSQVVTVAERLSWLRDHRRAGHPVLVAQSCSGPEAGEVLGYACLSGWRTAFDGYRFTAEDSVYVRADRRGRGCGRALAAALIDRAGQSGLHVIVAAIEAGNLPSIALHRGLGFQQTGAMPQVGVKFGRWLDLVLMQLILDDAPPPARP